MSDEVLVYVLPVERRPEKSLYIGHILGPDDPKAICRIDAETGEVYWFQNRSHIADIMSVLAQPPWGLTFEQLREVKPR